MFEETGDEQFKCVDMTLMNTHGMKHTDMTSIDKFKRPALFIIRHH